MLILEPHFTSMICFAVENPFPQGKVEPHIFLFIASYIYLLMAKVIADNKIDLLIAASK